MLPLPLFITDYVGNCVNFKATMTKRKNRVDKHNMYPFKFSTGVPYNFISNAIKANQEKKRITLMRGRNFE